MGGTQKHRPLEKTQYNVNIKLEANPILNIIKRY